MAMSVHRGRRWSTANAYLRPALRRSNLRVCCMRARPACCFPIGEPRVWRIVGVARSAKCTLRAR